MISYKQNSKCFILAIILSIWLCLSSLAKAAESEPLISQYMVTLEPNEAGSIIFTFNVSSYFKNPQLKGSDEKHFKIVDSNETHYQKGVQLIEALETNDFSFEIFSSDSNISMRVNGYFEKKCDDSCTSSCTVIIAFLASLCLVLFTALALALIILRRKKPITFKFGQQAQHPSDSTARFNSANDYEENESRKQSTLDLPNGVIKSVTTISEITPTTTPTYPRKSSLKPPRNSLSEQIVNNNYRKSSAKANSSHDNAAYIRTDLEKVDEEAGDKPNEEPKQFQETRRKSIVTFSEKTDVLPYS